MSQLLRDTRFNKDHFVKERNLNLMNQMWHLLPP